ATARAEFDQQLNTQVAAVRTEAGRAAAEAQKAAADSEARVRAELEDARDEAISTVRRSTEIELESGRRRAPREIQTEPERSNSVTEEAKAAIDKERQRANEMDGERQRAASELEQVRQRIHELEQGRQGAASELDQVRQRATAELEQARQRAAGDLEQERQR